MNSESMKTIQETKQHMLDSAASKNEYMTEGRRVLREERAARIARLNEEREQQEAEIRERANGHLISDNFEEKMAARQKAREERERQARAEEEERRKRREARLKLLMGEVEPPATPASAASSTLSGTEGTSGVVTTELVPGLDGVLIHPKVLCSQYARLVKNLQKEIASLKDTITCEFSFAFFHPFSPLFHYYFAFNFGIFQLFKSLFEITTNIFTQLS